MTSFVTYIGRFSLFHKGHAAVALRALKNYDKVLIIVGSDDLPRTVKNPWFAKERAKLIETWYKARLAEDTYLQLGELVVVTMRDFPYNNDRWLAEVQAIIATHKPGPAAYNGPANTIFITGAKRDDTSFYLDMFPSPTYELDLVAEDLQVSKFLTATWCREIYLGRSFNSAPLDDRAYDLLMRAFIPDETMNFLNEFQKIDPPYSITATAKEPPLGAFTYLLNEHRVITARKKELEGKYGLNVTLTADNVVIQSGHMLLIKRRASPGQGLWALPGGYVNPKEWTFEASLRELFEESSIKASPAAIRGSLVWDKWFEHPERSNINRVITHAFCFKLPDNKVNGRAVLAKVKGTDDALKAQWFPLAEVLKMSSVMFDDHFAIIEEVINSLNAKGKTS
jgi:bifunctional NMN adenylyltransferase/nudix hydrolase